MKWGFSGCTLLMNALTETAPFKETFRGAWTSHRCIISASWYFAWEHIVGNDGKKRTGDKYLIQPKGSAITWLCGCTGLRTAFVILTREPDEEIRFIHDRMPLIMLGENVDEWIRPDAKPEDLVETAMTEMVYEKVVDKPVQTDMQMSMLQ